MITSDSENIYSLISAVSVKLKDLNKERNFSQLNRLVNMLQENSAGVHNFEEVSKLMRCAINNLPFEKTLDNFQNTVKL